MNTGQEPGYLLGLYSILQRANDSPGYVMDE